MWFPGNKQRNTKYSLLTNHFFHLFVNLFFLQLIQCLPESDKLLVQRVKTTVNTISLQWQAPKKIAITNGLRPPLMMVYHYLLANGSEPLNSHNIPWSSKGVKIGLSSDQSTGSAIIENLRPNSKYLVKVEDDKMNETLIVETKDGCFHNSSIYNVGDRFNISCDQNCTCQINSTIKCVDRCSQSTKSKLIGDPNCKQKPDPLDPECCFIYQCEDELKPTIEARPKVLITSSTRTSIAIAWDDFKLPNYESGYVIEYKLVNDTLSNSANDTTNSDGNWIQVQGNNTPFWTLEGLRPGLSYLIRISLWEYPFDENNKKIDSSDHSEMITATTEDGCMNKDNVTFPVGKEITHGCQWRCTCQSGDNWFCKAVCLEPLILIGSNIDPSCSEAAVDDCCSTITCIETRSDPPPSVTTNSSEETTYSSPTLSSMSSPSPSSTSTLAPSVSSSSSSSSPSISSSTPSSSGSTELTFSDKPGYCYEPTKIRSDSGICLEECQHDYHCRGLDKCCPTSCGGSVCSEVNTGSPPSSKRCETITCGQNALCLDTRSDQEPPKCACKPGYRGDPFDSVNGCRKSNGRSNLICEYKNSTYGPGEEFFDGCEFKCVCSEALEVECNPRCPFIGSEEPVTTVDPLCTIIQDPKDSCCKTMACESKPVDVVKVNSSSLFNSDNDNENGDIGETIPVDGPLSVSGCRYENITYQPGESFVNGCESRCICKEGNRLQCAPRCPVFHGYNQKLCSLIPDPDDPECCKIAVCNTEKLSPSPAIKKMEPFELFIDSATVTNSSHMVLRLIIPNSIHHKAKHVFSIRYSKVDTEMISSSPSPIEMSSNRAWSSVEVSEDDLKLLEPGMFEIDFNGLSPNTDYFVEVKEVRSNSTSNTVFIKTFPVGVDSSFNGCFFNNKAYQVGDEFYDGCDYKCRCEKGGTRACDDRCPIYIDTIGFEECEWIASPEDPCCKIPDCSKKTEKYDEPPKSPIDNNSNEPSVNSPSTPTSETSSPVNPPPSLPGSVEPFCLGKDNSLHFIGEAWDESGPGGCLKQTCRCVQRANGTTTTQCHGGCPPIPSNAIKPTPSCPKPHIVNPSDACLCPYLICDHSVDEPERLPSKDQQNQSSSPAPPTTTPTASTTTMHLPDRSAYPNAESFPGLCLYKGQKIPIGKFNDGCQSVCECLPTGKVSCAPLNCPQFFDTPNEECLDWELDPNFIPSPPNCCPRPTCKNDGSCIFAGLRFPNFKPIPSELLPCGTRCVCMNSNVTCENRCPLIPDTPPTNLPCPPPLAYRGHLPGEDCCLHWMCRDTERAAFCLHNGNRYKVGDQWEDVNAGDILGPRRRCQCKPTPPLGKPQVDCFAGVCPKITERHLKPSAECPLPILISPEDPILCPYVICNYSEETGKELENVSVVAMNNSAVRIRFTLPSLFVGLIGHAEVHFTVDPTTPRHQWNVQKFARPKRLFDTANIEYHLGGLKSDTTYYFQVRILIEALHSGPESQVYKLYLPAPGSSVSGSHGYPLTSSTLIGSHSSVSSSAPLHPSISPTTSSTLPPQVTMDVNLKALAIDGTSVRLSWRNLDQQEKSLIDGITIKYRLTSDPFDKWTVTPMIHRDVNEYTLRDLRSGATYVIDLILRPSQGLTSQLLSAKPVTIEMPSRPRNDFDFSPSVDVTPESYRTMMKLRGLPRPTDKYVNVVKVNFREANSEGLENKMVHMFKTPSEDGTIIVDGLSPNNRYKAWIDLYLANGATISTDTVTFHTKDEPKLSNVIPENRDDDPSANEAEALKESSTGDAIKPYYIALMIVAVFAIITGIGFVTLLCVLMKTKTCAKAAITRASSEAAYDNPTYKTYDDEKPGEEQLKNGSA